MKIKPITYAILSLIVIVMIYLLSNKDIVNYIIQHIITDIMNNL